MRRSLVLALAFTCGGLDAAAQDTQVDVTSAQFEFRQPQGRPGAAANERLLPTASIRGRVATAGGAPIRGAEVRIRDVDSRDYRFTTTDGDGVYEMRDLIPGRWHVSVSKPGFLNQQFGQRRPFDAPQTLELRDGQRGSADFALARAGAVAGRVFDEYGDPLAGARVLVMRLQMVDGVRVPRTYGFPDMTDDMGAFRLFALPAGDYYVAVSPADALAPGMLPPRPGAVTFYPGTTNFSEAQRVTLRAGEEQLGLVIQRPPATRMVTVSGTVFDSSGLPAAGARVSLSAQGLPGEMAAVASGAATGDGTFALPNVPPGLYTLRAGVQKPIAGGPGLPAAPTGFALVAGESEIGTATVAVGAEDLRGVTVTAVPGATLAVTFLADAGASALPSSMNVTLRVRNSNGTSHMMGMGSTPERRVLTVQNAFSPFTLAADRLPDNWMVKAIEINGRDVTDGPIDLGGASSATVRVSLTDRITGLSGTVTTSRGEPAANANVVIFPEQSSRWTFPSRFLHAVRADASGSFSVTKLPPDGRYLVAAVDYLEPEEQFDVEFLESLKARAAAVSLGDGERRTVSLTLYER